MHRRVSGLSGVTEITTTNNPNLEAIREQESKTVSRGTRSNEKSESSLEVRDSPESFAKKFSSSPRNMALMERASSIQIISGAEQEPTLQFDDSRE